MSEGFIIIQILGYAFFGVFVTLAVREFIEDPFCGPSVAYALAALVLLATAITSTHLMLNGLKALVK